MKKHLHTLALAAICSISFAQTPAVPTLLTPTNAATGQAINSLVLDWNTAANATSYVWQYATNSSFTANALRGNIIGSTKTISSLQYSTTYYWRVKAKSATDSSAWSTAWSFTTIADPNPPAVAVPTLLTPTNAATGQAINSLVLDWNTAANATSYVWQYATNSSFTANALRGNIIGSTKTISSLQYSTTYYWRVKAKSATDSSAWSTAWSFTTIADPNPPAVAVPTLLTPTNAATGQAINSLVLDWNTAANATSYVWQYATNSSFTANALRGNITGSTKTISGLQYSTTYYWRVKAKSATDSSAWSTAWSFTTIVDPNPPAVAVPTLLTPTNAATGQAITSLVLDWNTAANATSYVWQYATNSTFTANALRGNITGSQKTISGLQYSTTYYWRVKAKSATDSSAWSTAWSFTTIADPNPPAVAVPTLLTPTNAATGQAITSLVLDWNTAANATSYVWQYATNSSFTANALRGNITGSQKTISGLQYSTTYYWRVKAKSATDSSAWSTAWSFTTIADPNPPVFSAPTLLTPTNGATGLAINSLVLDWGTVSGATGYVWQYATNSTFTAGALRGNITGSQKTISGLQYSTTYYWRVKAKSATDSTAWSTAWSFTTTANVSDINEEENNLVTIYPNPSKGVIQINTSLTNIKYSIFSITGKLIKNYPLETTTIDLSDLNLQPNLYLLQCISGDKIFYKKIILE